MGKYEYVILFFIYGLAFFSMGISALQQKGVKISNFQLLKSIKYLGIFGVIHGITEWVIMLRITSVYVEWDFALFLVQIFLNAFSFMFLLIFGLRLLQGTHDRKRSSYIPVCLFLLWATAVIYSVVFHDNYEFWFSFYSALSRYFLGFPATVITACALLKESKTMSLLKLNKIALNYKAMAFFFIIYGILAGVLVGEKNFFPANIINKELFQYIFGFPVELGRGIAAVVITVLFIQAIDIFRWEANEKITQLTKMQLISNERKKLAREIHDGIIQNLFATGLQVENLLGKEKDSQHRNNLKEIKSNLNDVISQIRDFMSKMVTKRIEIEDLKASLLELIQQFEKISDLDITFEYNIPPVVLGYLSPDKSTNVYYIVQEALYNVCKHADATKVKVKLTSDLNVVVVSVEDNGKGFKEDMVYSEKSYGIISMKERAELIQGSIAIENTSKGVKILLIAPWEEETSEKKD
ncbi:integral membrane sensor signal transduction histidine kinase [Clostridium aceticum]|uniref:histidine kinase n=1 Tax=Clostridium aceticum TaxID=84022 RepID=A0A0D8I7Z9_9CLOT|nr:sensor histidine kinase [Clostridium aceticum]AKL94320.1 integral membrane sensor signal transduction histidine kinase [Clostridium aceticum]KJF26162.1 hypothetical protein TZ02_15065 [Clostridium aceticum]